MTKKFVLTIAIEEGGLSLKGHTEGVEAESPEDMSIEEKFAATCLIKAKKAVDEYVEETYKFNDLIRNASPEEQAAIMAEYEGKGYTVQSREEEPADERPSILH